MSLDVKSARAFLQSGAPLALVPAVTWLAWQLHLNLAAASLLQLLVVLAVAVRAGFQQATLVSLLAIFFLNYFFVPPLFSFYVADPQNWIALGVFEVSALIVSRLSTQARQQAARALSSEREIERLYGFSRELLLLDRSRAQGAQILALIQRTFRMEAVVLWDAFSARMDRTEPAVAELESHTRAAYLKDREPPPLDDRTWIRVLRLGVRPTGAIGLRGADLTPVTVNSLASLIAIALERARSFESESQAQAERKGEQLRTAVLDALAHEYKTPLTSLRAAATGLLEIGGLNSIQVELLSLIDSEVSRLNHLTTRLLRMSRLDREDVKLQLEAVDSDELVRSVVGGMRDVLADRPVHIQSENGQAFVKADRELAGMALAQFLDNAAKYSEPASPISVSISPFAAEILISVRNFGPYIPTEERERIFERFYRNPLASHRVAGTGIGLSISRKIADAHRGRVWVTSDEESGNTFTLALPKHGPTQIKETI
jgi:two-component system sensor histidine kinase KdpD